MSEWEEIELAHLCDKIGSGATPKGGKEAYLESGISLIRSQNVHDFRFSEDGLAFINEEQADKLKNVIVKENDVLVNITGDSVARVCSAPKKFVPARVNQHVAIVRPNKKKLDWKYLKYFLLSPYQKAYLLTLSSSGATRNALTKSMLENLKINLPPFPEQKAIAHILGTLDDKIELNRQMNQTLEAMAQALFKSWFVDFDPVMDNLLSAGSEIPEELKTMAEKRQLVPDSKKLLHTNPSLAAQFPSAFVYNEVLGKWVPEGWGDVNLGKLIKIKHGYAFKGEYFSDEPTNNILLTPGNFKIGGGIKLEKLKYYNGKIPEDYILKKDDLIITMTDLSKEGDTLGFPAIIPQHDKLNFLHNQRLGKVEYLSNKIGSKFLFHCLCDREYRFVIVGSASGTTVKHTSPSKILLHNILFSGGQLEASFEEIVNANFEKIEINNLETETLTQLRDRLLPELISGRVRVEERVFYKK